MESNHPSGGLPRPAGFFKTRAPMRRDAPRDERESVAASGKSRNGSAALCRDAVGGPGCLARAVRLRCL